MKLDNNELGKMLVDLLNDKSLTNNNRYKYVKDLINYDKTLINYKYYSCCGYDGSLQTEKDGFNKRPLVHDTIGYPIIFKLFLKNGVDPYAIDEYGSPLQEIFQFNQDNHTICNSSSIWHRFTGTVQVHTRY